MEDLLALERGFWESPGHPEYYEQHMAADGLVIFAFEGGLIDKPAVLASVEPAGPWASYDIASPQLVHLSADCVALVYAATARRTGEPDYRANITSVYVRRNGAWQLGLHQQSPIGPA
jgi:hypothetical protein